MDPLSVLTKCHHCESEDFLRFRKISVELATSRPEPDRFEGEALVCRSCGHVRYFVSDVAALEETSEWEVVTVPRSPPYR